MGNRKNLEIYAERIRHRISKHNYGIGKRVTVSIGGALLPQDARNQKDLIKIVDERLYKAKNSGRNKSIVY
ncbi:diguanylate cyclase [Candidatus Woesearchaeota archaeon]|nr:diguanylate cyclase [Candidatus Woesearchaeota archaeon]